MRAIRVAFDSRRTLGLVGRLLRALGVLIALTSIGLGIYVQTAMGGILADRASRAAYGLSALETMTVGLLLAGLGHFLVLREGPARPT